MKPPSVLTFPTSRTESSHFHPSLRPRDPRVAQTWYKPGRTDRSRDQEESRPVGRPRVTRFRLTGWTLRHRGLRSRVLFVLRFVECCVSHRPVRPKVGGQSGPPLPCPNPSVGPLIVPTDAVPTVGVSPRVPTVEAHPFRVSAPDLQVPLWWVGPGPEEDGWSRGRDRVQDPHLDRRAGVGGVLSRIFI